jgi:hypothetical protein
MAAILGNGHYWASNFALPNFRSWQSADGLAVPPVLTLSGRSRRAALRHQILEGPFGPIQRPKPCSRAKTIACARDQTPSLSKTLDT